MRVLTHAAVTLTLALAAAGTGAAKIAPPTKPEITFAHQYVAASHLVPFGRSVWMTVIPKPVGFEQHVTAFSEVADHRGVISFGDLGVPRPSVWLIADLASGAYSFLGSQGYFPPRFELPAAVVRPGTTTTELLAALPSPDKLLWVKPGSRFWEGGAWMTADEIWTGRNSTLTVEHGLVPVATRFGPPPARLAAGDQLFVVRPADMAIAAAEVR